MRTLFLTFIAFSVSASSVAAQEVVYRSTLSEETVETSDLLIVLDPVDEDVRFAITLRNKETGFERRLEFEGQGVSDPSPFQVAWMEYCGAITILLTVEYPWRHDLPQYARVLETYAFRASDFAFIDMAFGPLTDIALLDSQDEGAEASEMQPPILVECVLNAADTPFRFVSKSGD